MNEYDGENRHVGRSRSTFVAIARLVRVPNLFTAPPDVVLGAALVAGLGYDVSLGAVAALSVASVALYAAGTTLNDYFDAAEDARERPERPLPSGDVSRAQALALGVALLGLGVATAWATVGTNAGVVAAALALLVAGYDGVFKGTPAGYLAMGSARGVNVLLGVTAGALPTSLPAESLSIPLVVAVYVAGVTYVAEGETGQSGRLPVVAAVAGLLVAVLGVVATLAIRSPPAVDAAVALCFLVGFLVWTGRPLRAAYADPGPDTIGPAVGRCVLGLVPLHAAFAATTGWVWAVAAAIFLVPATRLAAVFDVT